MEEKRDHQEFYEQPVTNKELQLELKAIKSDLRLMIIASVALNQFLTNVSLPSAISVPAITMAILAPAAKALLTLWGR